MAKARIPEELLTPIAGRLKALADPTRLRILHALEGEGELPVGEIVSRVGGSQANVSKHLSVLREAGLVRHRRQGTNILYAADEPAVFDICRLVCGCLERQAARRVAEIEAAGAALPGRRG